MTDADLIEAFQQRLDDDPADNDTRGVFADKLEDMGHWMATGMRWMWENGKWPHQWETHGKHWHWAQYGWPDHCLIGKYYDLLPMHEYEKHTASETEVMKEWRDRQNQHFLGSYPTRRDAESALCRALSAPCRRCHGKGLIPNERPNAFFDKLPCPDCSAERVTSHA